MRIAIYTANFDSKDEFRAPINLDFRKDIDYFYFTDLEKEFIVFPYKIINLPIQFNDIAKNSRKIKILGHQILETYDFVIWHDANIVLDISKIENLIIQSENSQTFISTFKHPYRDDFYSEAMACIRVEKDNHLKILRQSLYYFFKGLKAHKGLYSTGVLIKNYRFYDKDFVNHWWKQTQKFSRRDQLSLPFSIYKFNTRIGVITGNIFKNEYSEYFSHKHNFYNIKGSKREKNKLKMVSFYIVKCLRKLCKLK